jgi:hypothetical protein
VQQQYLPDEVASEVFYDPGDDGAEAALVARWRARQGRPVAQPPSQPPTKSDVRKEDEQP